MQVTKCLTIIFVLCLTKHGDCFYKPSCKKWSQYFFTAFSRNCHHNPDIFANTPEILRRHFGYYEAHKVTTEDGYILTAFRIPQKNPRGIIMLQHPVTADGIVFVGQGKDSLAYTLHQAGYEIWVPNHRGTFFSKSHISMKPSQFKYWDFGMLEIGIYDYAALIKYISNITNRNDIVFVGHSMSTTSSIIYAALKPDEAQKYLSVMIEMGPTTYMKNFRSPMKYLTPILDPYFANIFKALHVGAEFDTYSPTVTFAKSLIYLPFKKWVVDLMVLVFGGSAEEFEPSLYNIAFSQLPRTSAWKVIVHFAQLVNNGGRFCFYDYGAKENFARYNETEPPEVPLKNIKVPVFIMASNDDSAATSKDAEILYNNLPNQTKIYGKYIFSGLNHIDFHYGKDRKALVFDKILELLNKMF